MSLNPLLKRHPKTNFILGSQSPRRKELLAGLGVPFRVNAPNINETYSAKLTKQDIPIFLSEQKSKALELKKDELLITADTIVYCEGSTLEKPRNEHEALQMLRHLSGKTHVVYSAFCLRTQDKQVLDWDKTHVRFRPLNEDEICFYVNTYKPYDKAGAYGIQEWLGYIAIEEMNGSFYTVMGMPVHKLYNALLRF